MIGPRVLEPLPWRAGPAQVIAAWPSDRPLVALWSAEAGTAAPLGPWSRWTILAEPRATVTADATATCGRDPLALLASATAATAIRAPTASLPPVPFLGGWIGALAYELGEHLEPASRRRSPDPLDDRGWFLAQWHRCPAAYLFDHTTERWHRAGEAAAAADLPVPGSGPPDDRGFALGALTGTGREGYTAAVARCVEYVHAGDLFQANLSHRLSAPFTGSARGLFLALARRARPRYGAYLEAARGAETHAARRRIIASASPELFLSFDPGTRRLVTRPIKGTRPAHADPAELDAPKERAELSMIVDLMRHDLARVCLPGTVRVDHPRQLERHAVLHALATISGTVAPGLIVPEVLRAAFPPGSVTGAPKTRAMQIIRELEPVVRGPYCGCIGLLSDSGHATLSVAIRTAALSGPPGDPRSPDRITGGTMDYSVGAGIVAQSDPAAEWRETLHKAAIVRELAPDDLTTTCEHRP
ncbi:MAG TPA: anthranilate synthase component I family protein [Phycisphaerales bacterium]|nr:anthranilate synthase component I family protein [Phycisphaerales bacterium]